jgi:hypothetical protein
LFDTDRIRPFITILSEMHLKLNIWVLSCCEASQLRDPSTRSYRILQTAARLRNVFEENKYVKQIGFAGGVWPCDENSGA